MARKKIREYDSKRLLKAHILRMFNMALPLNVAQVRQQLEYRMHIISCTRSLPILHGSLNEIPVIHHDLLSNTVLLSSPKLIHFLPVILL
jgi:hypothetical protein